MPRDATSLEESETIVTSLESRERHWHVYRRIARSLDLPLAPDEMWLLIQICRSGPSLLPDLSNRFRVSLSRLTSTASLLVEKGIIKHSRESVTSTEFGRELFDRMVTAHRAVLSEFASR